MRNSSKVLMVFCAAMLMLSASFAYAGFDIKQVSKELSLDTFKEVSQIPDKPHFYLGLEPKSDPWEQNLELRKLWQTKDLMYSKNGLGLADKSNADLRIPANTEILEEIVVGGKTLRVFYTHHHYARDGMYYFWGKTGEKNLAEFSPIYKKYEAQWGVGRINGKEWNAIQRVLGWAQFEAIRIAVRDAIEGGLKKNLKDYRDINLTSGVIDARVELLDDPSYKDRLDEVVPGTSLRVRDILRVPLTRPEDFLPDLIIVGPRGVYGGFTNVMTPDTEKIVFLDLLGLAWGYVTKSDMLPAHEFTHANPYLQGWPLGFYFDVEMWAALMTDLDYDFTTYLFHPYLSVIRDSVRTTFGYDFEEVVRRTWPTTGASWYRDVREKEFRAHAAEVDKIRAELLRFIKEPKTGLLAMFYRDPYYWLAVNTKYCDTAAAWRIMFALRYQPAGLFDPDRKDKSGVTISPAVQTQEWLAKEEESGRIKRLAEAAMRKTGDPSEFAKKMTKVADSGNMKCPVDSRFFFMNKKEREGFTTIVEPLIEQARQGNVEARVLLMRIFNTPGILSQGLPR